jgi:hypothetical protein
MKVLNQIWVASELKFLLEGNIFKYKNPALAMKILVERLNNDSVIVITARDLSNSPVVAAFSNGQIAIAQGGSYRQTQWGYTSFSSLTIQQGKVNYLAKIGAPINLFLKWMLKALSNLRWDNMLKDLNFM